MKKLAFGLTAIAAFLLFSAATAETPTVKANITAAPTELILENSGCKVQLPRQVFTKTFDLEVSTTEARNLEYVEGTFVTKSVDIRMVDNHLTPISGLIKKSKISFKFDRIDYVRASKNNGSPMTHFSVAQWNDASKTWNPVDSIVFWNGEQGVVEGEAYLQPGRYALVWFNQPSKLSQQFDMQSRRLLMDHENVQTSVPLYVSNGRLMVPLRDIGNRLEATIYWDPKEQRIDFSRKGNIVKLWIGKTEAIKDGKPITIDVAPEISEGRTFVPLRFVAEALDKKVGWDPLTNTATIITY